MKERSILHYRKSLRKIERVRGKESGKPSRITNVRINFFER